MSVVRARLGVLGSRGAKSPFQFRVQGVGGGQASYGPASTVELVRARSLTSSVPVGEFDYVVGLLMFNSSAVGIRP
jgi:hypothetical protein